jgi:tryptophan-rich sensory protein
MGNNYHRIMEMMWLAIFAVTTVISGYMIYQSGFEESKLFLLMPLLALAFFFMRRTIRKRIEKNNRFNQ